MLIHLLRPKNLSQVIGQDEIVLSIKKQFDSGRIPHFFIIYGNPGTGKTTLSRIIAMMLQNADISSESIQKYDIKEINAADKNGIDDIRALIDNSAYKPYPPSVSKVVIMDEAHQLTTQAQNTLLKLTEDPPKYMYYIFCTTNLTKIIAALKRRAYIINTKGINKDSMIKLLNYANGYNLYSKDIKNNNWESLKDTEQETYIKKASTEKNIGPLCEALVKYDIDSPGLILQAAEKYFNGSDPDDCIFNSSNDSLDTLKLCNLISKGDWKGSAGILKDMKKEDIIMVKNCVLGYLKTILLKTDSDKALNTAKAIKAISEYADDLPTFFAYICIGCEYLKK